VKRRETPRTPPPPLSVGKLDKHVIALFKHGGGHVGRLRSWISYMTLGGALARAAESQGVRFAVKGGVALELRFGGRGRATEDIDIIALGSTEDLVEAFDRCIVDPYGEWRFKRHAEMHPLGPHGVRLRVQLAYKREHWATVQVDITRPDSTEEETECLPGISLTPFGLEGPREIECLSLRFQIAQKFHGLTKPVTGDGDNQRYRDAVDLLLLRELVAATDLPAIRAACEITFRLRGTHPWPPPIVLPPRWRAPYAALATDVGLAVTALDAAERALQAFLSELLSA